MNRTSPYKSNQFLWLVFKLLTVILCGYFIYDTIANNKDLKLIDFYSKMIDFDVFSIKNIVLLLVFTLINWFLEIKKWKTLTKRVTEISLIEATRQSLSSLTFSLITPNRIGEYGAKALYFKKEKRKEVLLLNFVGNFYQLLTTILLGIIGVVYLIAYFSFSFITIQKSILILLVVIIFSIVLFFLQKKFQFLNRLIKKIIKAISFKNNTSILFLSLLRYLVFSHQFYFLLMIFDVDISYLNAISGIVSMYLIASCIPVISLFDFVVKGSVAILVFSLFNVNILNVLSITTIMWIFNFAFPAILGSYFVLQFKPVEE